MNRTRVNSDEARALRQVIRDVVDGGNCSGCGACALLDAGVRMALGSNGFLRPTESALEDDPEFRVSDFMAICPGVNVRLSDPNSGPFFDTIIGAYFGVYEAYAIDDNLRFEGASGGALSAIARFCLDTGRATTYIGLKGSDESPAESVASALTQADDVAGLASSRYGPGATLPLLASSTHEGPAVISCKPCEASALRALEGSAIRREWLTESPVRLSFFCAGVPSQRATDKLLGSVGGNRDDLGAVTSLRYRGAGWPGRFRAQFARGAVVDKSYEASWGEVLGKDLQWRCKICADSTGESADIVAADYWTVDAKGFPIFSDQEGRSAIVVRSARGAEILEAAVAQGYVSSRRISVDSLTAVQPYQVTRRHEVWARLQGSRLAGFAGPRYYGYSLRPRTLTQAYRGLRASWGTWRRRRRGEY